MTNNLPMCPYGSTCYRKCKTHFDEFSHTEDYKTMTDVRCCPYFKKYRHKIYPQWLITKEKWITDKSYKDPLLGYCRNDFGVQPDNNVECSLEVYICMYRHHDDWENPVMIKLDT